MHPLHTTRLPEKIIYSNQPKRISPSFFHLFFFNMESSLLNTSSTHIEKVYHQVLKTITKNKWTSISAAVLLSTSLIIHETILKPPKNLRHIPYHSYFDAFWSSLRGESYYQTSKRIMLPYINSNNNYRGLYCVRRMSLFYLHSNPFFFFFEKKKLETRKSWLDVTYF